MKTLKLVTLFAALLIIGSSTLKAEEKTEKSTTEVSSTMINLNGKVVDETTGEGLAGVSLLINGETVYTDFDGNFILNQHKSEDYSISASYISYKEKFINTKLNNMQSFTIKLQSL